ncbi:hypothetical protein PF005_g19930 [Phytophthora fragariae]|nr:hypothetical protein PF006_g25217 [Phytophthora fragariae]KAE9188747.1 hypothetical protein PF005_g19930 [Phytophthora fragariae]
MKLAIGLVLAAVAVASVSAGDPATLSSKTPVEEATKTTKATKSSKSTKTSETSGSGIGSLFDDGSGGVIGDESDLKLLTSIGITVPMIEAGSKFDLGLGPGPAVYLAIRARGTGAGTRWKAQAAATTIAIRSARPTTSLFAAPTMSPTRMSVPSLLLSATRPSWPWQTQARVPERMLHAPRKIKGETGEKKKIVDFTALDEPTIVKGMKEAEAPSTATKSSKSTKATKSEKTGTASDSGIGSLFEDGSDGIIGENESGSADPTLVKGAVDSLVNGTKTHADEEQQSVSEKTLPAAKSTKVTV